MIRGARASPSATWDRGDEYGAIHGALRVCTLRGEAGGEGSRVCGPDPSASLELESLALGRVPGRPKAASRASLSQLLPPHP